MSGRQQVDAFPEGLVLELPDEEASRVFAEDVAILLRTGDMVSLSGDLGAGKTTLARAVLRYLAGDDAMEVPSPTYTLVQTYETRPKATHFDLYRIEGDGELAELGLEEAAETGVVLVEWPERSELVGSEANLTLSLEVAPGGGRNLIVGAAAETALRLSRSLRIRRFLENAGHGKARRLPFRADASARRYEHVEGPDGPMVLMDAPRLARGPVLPNGRTYAEIAHIAQDVTAFVALAKALAAKGFSVPEVHAVDLDSGLVLLEDLGDEGILDAEGKPIPERYEAAARCLALLHDDPFEPEIAIGGHSYRVPDFDRGAMAIEVSLMVDWFVPRLTGRPAEGAARERFEAVWDALFDTIEGAERRLVLRDFHSPNILWRDEREDCRRVGLLDFQDAMIGPSAYDLASLAQDARVDVPAELEQRLIAAYRDARSEDEGFDVASFEHAYRVMAVQRATKILGIFVRLHERDGKPQYLRHIPRIQAYLKRTLVHPDLSALMELYEDWGVLDADLAQGRR